MDIDKNIEGNNPNKNPKVLIVFDDMITDMLNNKKCNPVVTELFVSGRKLRISLFLLHNQIKLGEIIRAILLLKVQTHENFSKQHLIFHQILTLKTL